MSWKKIGGIDRTHSYQTVNVPVLTSSGNLEVDALIANSLTATKTLRIGALSFTSSELLLDKLSIFGSFKQFGNRLQIVYKPNLPTALITLIDSNPGGGSANGPEASVDRVIRNAIQHDDDDVLAINKHDNDVTMNNTLVKSFYTGGVKLYSGINTAGTDDHDERIELIGSTNISGNYIDISGNDTNNKVQIKGKDIDIIGYHLTSSVRDDDVNIQSNNIKIHQDNATNDNYITMNNNSLHLKSDEIKLSSTNDNSTVNSVSYADLPTKRYIKFDKNSMVINYANSDFTHQSGTGKDSIKNVVVNGDLRVTGSTYLTIASVDTTYLNSSDGVKNLVTYFANESNGDELTLKLGIHDTTNSNINNTDVTAFKNSTYLTVDGQSQFYKTLFLRNNRTIDYDGTNTTTVTTNTNSGLSSNDGNFYLWSGSGGYSTFKVDSSPFNQTRSDVGTGATITRIVIAGDSITSIKVSGAGTGYTPGDRLVISLNSVKLGPYIIKNTDLNSTTLRGDSTTNLLTGTLPTILNNISNGTYFSITSTTTNDSNTTATISNVTTTGTGTDSKLKSFTVSSGGSGYAGGDILKITADGIEYTGYTLIGSHVNSGALITSTINLGATITTNGSGNNDIVISNVVIGSTGLTSFTITGGGTGYNANDTITISITPNLGSATVYGSYTIPSVSDGALPVATVTIGSALNLSSGTALPVGNYTLSDVMPTANGNAIATTYTNSSFTATTESGGSGAIVEQVIISGNPGVVTSFTMAASGTGYAAGDLFTIEIFNNNTIKPLGYYIIQSGDITASTGAFISQKITTNLPSNIYGIANGTYNRSSGLLINNFMISNKVITSMDVIASGSKYTANEKIKISINDKIVGNYTIPDTGVLLDGSFKSKTFISSDLTSMSRTPPTVSELIVSSGSVTSVKISGGSNYVVGDKIVIKQTISSPSESRYVGPYIVTLDDIDSNGVFKSELTSGGFTADHYLNGLMPTDPNNIGNGTYTSAITVATNGSGSSASVSEVVITGTKVISVKMNAAGSNYVPGDTITISIDGVALGTYTITGKLTGIMPVNPSTESDLTGNAIADGTHTTNLTVVSREPGGLDDGTYINKISKQTFLHSNQLNFSTTSSEITNQPATFPLTNMVITSSGNVGVGETANIPSKLLSIGYNDSGFSKGSSDDLILYSKDNIALTTDSSGYLTAGKGIGSTVTSNNSSVISRINEINTSLGSSSTKPIGFETSGGLQLLSSVKSTYDGVPITTTTGGNGTGAIVSQVVIASGSITSVTMEASGSGYATGDTLIISIAPINGSVTALGSYTIAVGDHTNGVFNSGNLAGTPANNSSPIANGTYNHRDAPTGVRLYGYGSVSGGGISMEVVKPSNQNVLNTAIQRFEGIPTEVFRLSEESDHTKLLLGNTTQNVKLSIPAQSVADGNGKDLYIDAGTKNGSGSDGVVHIGKNNTSKVEVTNLTLTELDLNSVSSAVNKFKISDASTGTGPMIESIGDTDDTIDMELITKSYDYSNKYGKFKFRTKQNTITLNTVSGSGSGAEISSIVTSASQLTSFTISKGGSGYATGDTISITVNSTTYGTHTIVSGNHSSGSFNIATISGLTLSTSDTALSAGTYDVYKAFSFISEDGLTLFNKSNNSKILLQPITGSYTTYETITLPNETGTVCVSGGSGLSLNATTGEMTLALNSGAGTIGKSNELITALGSLKVSEKFETVGDTITLPANASYDAHKIACGTITEYNGTSTHALITGLHITPPTITNDATATVTDASTLYISEATNATGANNYSFLVASGNTKLNGDVEITGTVSLSSGISISQGGTGSTTANVARGSTKLNAQRLDPNLSAISSVLQDGTTGGIGAASANKIIKYTSAAAASFLDFKHEDTLGSDSATAIPSQQSVKAYVDNKKPATAVLADKSEKIKTTVDVTTDTTRYIPYTAAATAVDNASLLIGNKLAFNPDSGSMTIGAGNLRLTATGVVLDQNLQTTAGVNFESVTTTGNITIGHDLILNTDSSRITMGADDDISFTHDGTTGLTIAAQPITLDSGGDITLDTGTDNIFLKKQDTTFGSLTKASGNNLIIKSGTTPAVTFSGANTALAGSLTLGTALAVNHGGTGGTDAGAARTNLGLGTDDSPQFTSASITTQGGNANDVTRKAYVDGVAQGLNIHTPVVLASVKHDNSTYAQLESVSYNNDAQFNDWRVKDGSLNATYNNGTSGVGATLTANFPGGFDKVKWDGSILTAPDGSGEALDTGDRVLIKNQTNAAHNGIYTITSLGGYSTDSTGNQRKFLSMFNDPNPRSEIAAKVTAHSTMITSDYFPDRDGHIVVGQRFVSGVGVPTGAVITGVYTFGSPLQLNITFDIGQSGGGTVQSSYSTMVTTGSKLPSITFTGTITIDSATIGGIPLANLNQKVTLGQTITGPGIPTGTTISSLYYASGGTLVMSQNATESGTISITTVAYDGLVGVGSGGTIDSVDILRTSSGPYFHFITSITFTNTSGSGYKAGDYINVIVGDDDHERLFFSFPLTSDQILNASGQLKDTALDLTTSPPAIASDVNAASVYSLVGYDVASLPSGTYERDTQASSKWQLTRATDADSAASGELHCAYVLIENGSQANSGFIEDGGISGGTVGTTNVNFIQFSGAENVVAGVGINKSSTTISVDLNTNGGLVIDSSKISIDLTKTAIIGPLPINKGGTGATSAAAALAAFGAQAANSNLTAISGLTNTINKIMKFAGSNNIQLLDFNPDADLATASQSKIPSEKVVATYVTGVAKAYSSGKVVTLEDTSSNSYLPLTFTVNTNSQPGGDIIKVDPDLTWKPNAGELRFGGNHTFKATGNSIVNQDLQISASPKFAAVNILSTGSQYLKLKTANDLTASDKTLTFTTGNADRGITLGGNFTTEDGNVTIDAVSGSKTLTMNSDLTVGAGGYGVTITALGQANTFTMNHNLTIGSGNNVTITALGSARTFTMNESLTIGDGSDGTITFGAAGKTLTVNESLTIGAGNSGTIAFGAASKILTVNENFTIGGTQSGTLAFGASSKTLTVSETCTINQNLQTTATPKFASLGLEGASAYLTLKNSTDENGDGQAETRIIFKDHTDNVLAQIQGSHDGTANDVKGDLILSTNTGSGLSERMRIDSGGNVGIDKTNPAYKLDVTGSISGNYNSDTTSYFGYAAIGFTSSFSDKATFAHIDMNTASNYALLQDNAGKTLLNCTSGQSIGFRISNSDKMVLTSAGNFGIGTTSPTSKLDVNGSISVTGTGTYKLDNQTIIKNNTDAATPDIYANLRVIQNISMSDGMYINYGSLGTTAADLRLYANATTQRMIIKADTGNVGIGTTTPGCLLHVNSETAGNATLVAKISAGSADGNHAFLGFGTESDTAYTKAAIGYKRTGNNERGDIGFYTNSENTTNSVTNADLRMVVTSQGNVGIGTTSPRTPLDVNGKLCIGFDPNTTLDGTGALHITTPYTIPSNTDGVEPLFNQNESITFYSNIYSFYSSATQQTYYENQSPTPAARIWYQPTTYNYVGSGVDGKHGLLAFGCGNKAEASNPGDRNFYSKTMVITSHGDVQIGEDWTNSTLYINEDNKFNFTGTGNSSSDTGDTIIGGGGGDSVSLLVGTRSSNSTFRKVGSLSSSGGSSSSSQQSEKVSGYFENNVLVEGKLFIHSDKRIKCNINEIDDDKALVDFRKLKPSTYQYINKFTKTNTTVYGFIAQEVKEVLPYACNPKNTSFIPNIYCFATISGNYLTASTDFDSNLDPNIKTNFNDLTLELTDKNGNKVAYIKIMSPTGKKIYRKVIRIVNNTTIELEKAIDPNDVIDPDTNTSYVFVIGQEVNDFHTIDKNAIWTVTAAATQEIDRQLQAEKQKVANLESQLASVLQRLAAAGI